MRKPAPERRTGLIGKQRRDSLSEKLAHHGGIPVVGNLQEGVNCLRIHGIAVRLVIEPRTFLSRQHKGVPHPRPLPRARDGAVVQQRPVLRKRNGVTLQIVRRALFQCLRQQTS